MSMRFIARRVFIAIVFFFTLVLLVLTPAARAAAPAVTIPPISSWTCSGPDYVCGVTHYANYAPGDYYVRAWTRDSYGNWSATPSSPVKVILTYPPLSATCSVSPTSGYVGDTFTWTHTTATGGNRSYTYSWSGGPSATGNPNNLEGTGISVTKSYTTSGTKTGTITVTSAGVSQAFSCGSVTVSERPDLTAGAPTVSRSPGMVGRDETLSATITNSGAGSTGAGFTNLFQRADTYNSSTGAVTNVQDIGATNSSTLSPGGTVAVSLTTSTSIFSNTDANTTRYIRVCADKINKNDSIGSITTESNETNNCGGWTSVVVYPALTATCTMTSSGPPTGFTGNYTSRTYTYTVSAAGGAGTGSYTYSAWSGTDGLTGSAPSTTKKYTTSGTKTAAITVTSAGFQKVAVCSIVVQPIADLIVTPP